MRRKTAVEAPQQVVVVPPSPVTEQEGVIDLDPDSKLDRLHDAIRHTQELASHMVREAAIELVMRDDSDSDHDYFVALENAVHTYLGVSNIHEDFAAVNSKN